MAGAVVSLVAWLVAAWLYLQPPALSYPEIPFPVVTTKVKAGEVVQVRVTRCNADPSPHSYTVLRQLSKVDGTQVYVYPSSTITVVPGCVVVTSVLNTIPEGTPPGKYFISGVTETNDRLRPNAIPWHTDTFEVLP